jgi:hypothetical protein
MNRKTETFKKLAMLNVIVNIICSTFTCSGTYLAHFILSNSYQLNNHVETVVVPFLILLAVSTIATNQINKYFINKYDKSVNVKISELIVSISKESNKDVDEVERVVSDVTECVRNIIS